MKISQINKITKGWFVGNFEPTLYKTNDVEVAVKEYKAGDFEGKHFHKIATEITVVISGVVLMNGIEYKAGDIIIIEPNEVADFKALTNSKNVVVKLPGANNDKYIVNE